jgi:hypothetical protein
MPRISVKLIEERETFTSQNFQAGMSIEQANDALVQKYGMKMNPKRLKELFDANKQDSTHTVIPSGEDARTVSNGIAEFAKMNPKRLKELFDANKQDSTHTVIPSGEDARTVSNGIAEFAKMNPVVFAPSVSPMRPTSKITAEGCLPIGELVEQLEQGTYPLAIAPIVVSTNQLNCLKIS